jgi:cysteine sulfinate desulfinase/cysteine desulfurase-like protein
MDALQQRGTPSGTTNIADATSMTVAAKSISKGVKQ